jgi:arsenate reductase-like glutaredoxin family protein
VLSKLDWARDSRSELQLGDVRHLLESPLDEAYLNHWAARLGLEELLKEARRA